MKPRLATVRHIGGNLWKVSPYRYGAGFETFTLSAAFPDELSAKLKERNLLAV
jgi:hypothetical protein